ncbi:MAG: hypothetical protein V4714_08245 [Bacteroidota bacterium]
MADCFTSYIGLKGCGAVAPTSGLYINSLPGISTELADKIANADQVSFAGVWSDVQTIAKGQILNDIVNGLSEKINFHEVAYQTKRPRPSRTKETIPASADYRGVLIEAPESRYSQIRIKSLFVFSATAGSVSLKAWNIWDGSEVLAQTVTLVVGLNEVPLDLEIDLSFSENSVFIGLDCSATDTIYFLQQEDDFWNFWDGECPYMGSYSSQPLRIDAASMALTDLPDYSTITRTSKPLGVWVTAEVVCSSELYLCENLHHFKTAILNLLGWQLLMFKLGSNRINFFTITREDVTEKLMSTFKADYESNIKRTLAAIPIEGSGFCFDCDGVQTYEVQGVMP